MGTLSYESVPIALKEQYERRQDVTFFAELEILPLTLADQGKVAKLNLLAKQETQLLKKLADEKERYYAAVIDYTQKNMRRKTP